MHVSELDTFIDKFKQLWFCCVDVHLDVNTQAGHAWVGLHLRLGAAPPGPPHFHLHQEQERPRHVGPAQLRRRERRKAGRQADAEVARRHEPASCDAEEVEHNVENDEEVNTDNEEIVIADITNAGEASTDTDNYSCELCDSNFKNFVFMKEKLTKQIGVPIYPS